VQEALLHAAGKRPAAQRKGLVSPLLLAPAPAPEVFVSVTQQACRLPSKLDEGGAAASDPGFGKSSPSQASFWYTSPARQVVVCFQCPVYPNSVRVLAGHDAVSAAAWSPLVETPQSAQCLLPWPSLSRASALFGRTGSDCLLPKVPKVPDCSRKCQQRTASAERAQGPFRVLDETSGMGQRVTKSIPRTAPTGTWY